MANTTPNPICAFAVSSDGVSRPIALPSDLQTLSKTDGYVWLHFDVGDPAFEAWLMHQLPVTVAKALVASETRPRCDRVENGLVVNLRGVNMNPGADAEDMVSLRLWVTEGLIVSARVRKVWAVDAIRQQMEAGQAPVSTTLFLAELAHGLTRRIEKVSLTLAEETDAFEEHALSPSTTLAAELAGLRQSVIKLRRFVRPQSEAIAELADGKIWPLEAHSTNLFLETANQTARTMEELEATSDRLRAVQDHLDMLHMSALGRNSYVLSIVAAIFLPLGFLTGLFGVNVGGMPGVDAALGFWAVTISSILIGFVLFFVFRHLKWL
ncbi:zinc transporter ZntB [Shimia thalassica]|uniref:zinc transporter ZntB n=1 Tax=Shimia thalassica TaxID=1715693 RepID=UPI001C091836|nr:zinc transporter ZntB [Shimia thalassica]MBU2941561.1 zinc transporter ZntB [Shimia thalassica]MDO6504058.1 zinc transporter ZntB [Shimia thalassica]